MVGIKENDLSNVSSKHNAGVRTVIVTLALPYVVDLNNISRRNRRSHAPGHPCCCGGCCGGSAVGALQYASRRSVLFCSQTSRSHLRVLILLFSSRRRLTILFLSSFRGSGTSAGKDEAAKSRTWDW